ANERPGFGRADPGGAPADDERDFTFESQQFGPCGPSNLIIAGGQRTGGLEEIRWRRRPASTLGGARFITQMHGDDFAGGRWQRPVLVSVCRVIHINNPCSVGCTSRDGWRRLHNTCFSSYTKLYMLRNIHYRLRCDGKERTCNSITTATYPTIPE